MMKDKEFVREVKTLDFVDEVINGGETFHIKNIRMSTIISIEKNEFYSLDTRWSSYKGLSNEEKKMLMDIVIPYISTPTEERKDEKRYYVRSKFDNSDYNHLNLSDLGHTYIGNKLESLENQTKFTIDKLKELGIQFDENDEPYEWTLKEVAE